VSKPHELSVRRVLRGALAKIQDDGWTQYELIDADGQVCVNGALLVGLYGDLPTGRRAEWPKPGTTNAEILTEAALRVSDAVGDTWVRARHDRQMHLSTFHLAQWNNNPERTREDVEGALTAALDVRGA
jgi:hypothetical protein